VTLDIAENSAKKEAKVGLSKLLHVEETKWAQRAKVRHVWEGHNKTRYFHLIANGEHRMKRFFQLEQDEWMIVGQDHLKTYSTNFYK
jgi:hypothetical protein